MDGTGDGASIPHGTGIPGSTIHGYMILGTMTHGTDLGAITMATGAVTTAILIMDMAIMVWAAPTTDFSSTTGEIPIAGRESAECQLPAMQAAAL